MKYYLIAGEASGDLHASHLMAALGKEDAEAQFRGFGGDLMQAQGMTLVRHYRDLAYMGLIPVLLHARTILRGMEQCKRDIAEWHPDVLILVDYPGFNLKIAKFVRQNAICPVFYYIAPKLWAWKEWRIKAVKRDVDEIFSILPFEVDFFEGKHGYPIHYVGNPTVDEVEAYRKGVKGEELRGRNEELKCIALLPGSRKQEISDNLGRMLEAVSPFMDRYRVVIAKAPNISDEQYRRFIRGTYAETVSFTTDTYALLSTATAALVTSGTATLETALFRVPQVVCYRMKGGILASLVRRVLLNIPYVSLVNLIAGSEVVPELVAEQMTVANCRRHLAAVLPGGPARTAMLEGYKKMASRLGEPGAPMCAARKMVELLRES